MNVQTIPRSDKLIKRAFIPKLDALLFFDYKQIEYRLLAYYIATAVGDEGMAQVFRDGEDLHAESARSVLSIGDREPTDEERQVGKTFNFATIYGQGAWKCAETLGVDIDVAKAMLEQFHLRWPAIKVLHNPPFKSGGYKGQPGLIQKRLDPNARSPLYQGYIKTLFGRKLHPQEAHAALNYLIQGSAGDLTRWAMVNVYKWLRAEGLESHLVNTVHDELTFDCPADELVALVNNIPGLMDYKPISEVVPVEVDIGISTTNWAEKEEADADQVEWIADNLGSDHGRRETAAA